MCARALPEPDLFQKIAQNQLTDHLVEKLAAPARRYQAEVPSLGQGEGAPKHRATDALEGSGVLQTCRADGGGGGSSKR